MANRLKKFFSNFGDITEYYNFLVNKTKNHEYVDITNEWLIDNYYLLVEHKNTILNIKKQLKKKSKIINENYYLLKDLANSKNYNISFRILIEELKRQQRDHNKVFTYAELSSVFSILIFIYTEKLNEICREEYHKLIDKEDVSNIIKNHENLKVEDFLPENFDINNNTHFIFEVNNQLYRVGNNSNDLFKELNEYLKNHNVSLKELMNEEYQKKI